MGQFSEGVFVADASQVAVRGLASSGQGHGGITVDHPSDITIADNVVRDYGAGIVVAHAGGVLVNAKRVSGSGAGGIPGLESHQVRIADNTVTTSATDAAIGLFDGSAQNEVTGNRLSRGGAGIALDNGAADNLIADNAIAHNAIGLGR